MEAEACLPKAEKKIPGHLWQWPRRLCSRVSPIQSCFALHEERRIGVDARPELRLRLPTKLAQPRTKQTSYWGQNNYEIAIEFFPGAHILW